MKITLALQSHTITFENDAVSDVSEMGHAFGDNEEGNVCCYARICGAFHLIWVSDFCD